MSLRDRFARENPDFPLLSEERPEQVGELLRSLGWLEPDESVESCSRAGDGNMNLTLRLVTDRRSMIVKQARPWVEKYDTIAAPFERATIERRFYQRTASIDGVAEHMPALLASSDEYRLLLFEDLGEAQDLSSLYRVGELSHEDARCLGAYLRALHMATRDGDERARGPRDGDDAILANRAMRALNHEHLFEVPYRSEVPVDLEAFEPGLGAVAADLREDAELLRKVEAMGRRYLDDGPSLLHGDFFPGSWLRLADGGLAVIDPEFCFFGDPEFDLGVAVAHLVLSRHSFGVDDELIHAAVDPDPAVRVHESLVARYAGVEVIRRLLGVAQLPIVPTDGFRASMVRRARVAILEETLEAFRT